MLSLSETSAAAMAARRPAAPPPTITMSCTRVSRSIPPGRAAGNLTRGSEPIEQDRPLDVLDRLGDLDATGTGLRAVEGGPAPEHARSLAQHLQALSPAPISRVVDEPVGVHDRGRAHVLLIAPEDGA